METPTSAASPANGSIREITIRPKWESGVLKGMVMNSAVGSFQYSGMPNTMASGRLRVVGQGPLYESRGSLISASRYPDR